MDYKYNDLDQVSVDCPESKQPYSGVVTRFLSDAIFGNRVTVVVDSRDRYAVPWDGCSNDSKNINKELLKAGLTWHYKRYSKDEELQA